MPDPDLYSALHKSGPTRSKYLPSGRTVEITPRHSVQLQRDVLISISPHLADDVRYIFLANESTESAYGHIHRVDAEIGPDSRVHLAGDKGISYCIKFFKSPRLPYSATSCDLRDEELHYASRIPGLEARASGVGPRGLSGMSMRWFGDYHLGAVTRLGYWQCLHLDYNPFSKRFVMLEEICCNRNTLILYQGTLYEVDYRAKNLKPVNARNHQEIPVCEALKSAIAAQEYKKLQTASGSTLEHIFRLKSLDPSSQRYLGTNARLSLTIKILEAAEEQLFRNAIVHNDIKPENIIMSHDGTIRFIDFGLSCQINTDIKNFSGAVLYSSPEKYRMYRHRTKYAPGSALTKLCMEPSSDIYSIGKVLAILWGVDETQFGTTLTEAEYAMDKPVELLKSLFTLLPETPGDAVCEGVRHALMAMLDPNPKARPAPQMVAGSLRVLLESCVLAEKQSACERLIQASMPGLS